MLFFFDQYKLIDPNIKNLNYVNLAPRPMINQNNSYKEIIKNSRNLWLETKWKSLIKYVYLDPKSNKFRLIMSKEEYEINKKSPYELDDKKFNFLRKKIITKKVGKYQLKLYLKKYHVLNVRKISKFIYKYIKKFISNEIKRFT